MDGRRPPSGHNLPPPLTSFIGREQAIAEGKRLLSSAHLLTFTGAGGCGKTRLALRIATDLVNDYADGAWWVELAALSEPHLVPHTVASALGVPEHPGRSMLDMLVESLRPKSLVLLLDNCEHVLLAAAGLAETLLRQCPTLRILATSRESLGVPGEVQYVVPPLSVPDPQGVPSVEDLIRSEAAQLFVERAAAVQPAFTATRENAQAIAHLCRHLDGIPLALELAAARVKVLAVEQIVARLDDRFGLLTGGSRTAVPRHQTLRATMDWSYDLLSEPERALWRRLSVFAGGCTLEAVEAVCAGRGLEAAEILDRLSELVDKSLVQVLVRDGEARYAMLETVRQYGRDRVEEAGEAGEVRRRHRDWYVALAERAEPELRGPNQVAWLERLEENHDNFRAALEWSKTDAGRDAAGLRLAAALCNFWDTRGHVAEGRTWLDGMLSVHKEAAPMLRVKALNRAARLAHFQGDYVGVSALCEEALSLSRAEGDKKGSADALHFLAHAAEGAGDYHRASKLLERSVALHRAAGITLSLAACLNCLANTAREGANYRKAADLYEEALTLFHRFGDRVGRETALHNLGYVVLRQRDHQRSRALFRESLTLAGELGDRRFMVKCLAGFAGASAETKPESAAKLFGAASALMSAAGIRLEPFNRRDFDHYAAVAKGRLGERTFNAAWEKGAALTLEQALGDALVTEDAATPADATVNKLTPREREVASLIAQGLTNRGIASRLLIAERTVDAHVEHILNKLGFNSRAQIAAWAVETGLCKASPE